MMTECYCESGCRTKELAFSSLVDTLARRRKADRPHQSDNVLMTQRQSPRRGLGCGNDVALPCKGLLNQSGENSCFLNSTIQVLWHVDAFRNNFRLLSAHACTENSCVFCAIKVLFTQFQYSDHETIPSDCLRIALAKTFAVTGRFQVGLMDDAAECFEKIMLGLHWHLTNDQPVDQCTAGHCITHRKFTMYIIEENFCSCGWTSSRHHFNQTVLYTSTSALIAQDHSVHSVNAITSVESVSSRNFGRRLRSAFTNANRQRCRQVGCLGTLSRRRALINNPDVINIGLVWDSEHADVRHIRSVMDTVAMEIDTDDIFSKQDGVTSSPSKLQLTAIVCYHHRHYCTLVHHVDGDVWTCLDDAIIKQIGSGWSVVVEKICSGKYQPLLLVYVNPKSCQPITMQTAPSQTFFVSNLRQFQKTLDLTVRHKPADYDGGGRLATEKTITRAHITRNRHAVDLPPMPPFSVDVDTCLRSLTSPHRSSSQSSERDVIIAGSNPPLIVPEWLTSTDDLTSLTGATRYINTSTVESILRRRGIERLEPAACVDDATRMSRDSHEVRHCFTDTSRHITSGCVDRSVIDVVEYCSPRSSSRTTEGGTSADVGNRRRSTGDERQSSVSCVSEITTRVRKIAIASRSECYYGLRCIPYESVKSAGCWPRRLPSESSQTKSLSCAAASTSSIEAAFDLPNDVTSKKKKKSVSFADRMTTIVVFSDEIPPTCDTGSSYVSATFSGALSTSYSGAPQRCEWIDDESLSPEIFAVVSSTSEDDVDSLDVDAEDDEGFVDEHGITSSASGPGTMLPAGPKHTDRVRCGLCRRHWVLPPVKYCVDCETYFARFASA